MEEGMSSISYTILELSNDILAMADKIGDMSLQIGIMADRIVQTEVLLADVLLIHWTRKFYHSYSSCGKLHLGTWNSCYST